MKKYNAAKPPKESWEFLERELKRRQRQTIAECGDCALLFIDVGEEA